MHVLALKDRKGNRGRQLVGGAESEGAFLELEFRAGLRLLRLLF